MIRVGVNTKPFDDTVSKYQQAMDKAPGVMATLTRRRISKSSSRILKRLSVEPDAQPDLPFVWSYNPAKQARARAWYFANVVGEESGGRYKRTHKTAKAWKVNVTVDQNGGVITASNNSKGIDYVEGDRQVPSHYLTGWLTPTDIDEIILQEGVILEDQLTEDWHTALDPFAGVR